jgi:hypothetical protein
MSNNGQCTLTVRIEYLYSMIVRVSNDNVALSIDGDARWFCELSFEYAELAELLMIDHFLSFQC